MATSFGGFGGFGSQYSIPTSRQGDQQAGGYDAATGSGYYNPGAANVSGTAGGMNLAAANASNQARQQFGYNTELQKQQQDSAFRQLQTQLGGQQQMAEQAQAGEKERAEIAAAAQEYAPTLQQQRFQQVFPMLQGIVGQVQGLAAQPGTTPSPSQPSQPSQPQAVGGGGGTNSQGIPTINGLGGGATPQAIGAMQGSQPGSQPTAIGAATGAAGLTPLQQAGILQPGNPIAANPVLNKKQIDDQVNAMRAGTDASAASQMRNQSGQLAGRGFGSNSPLAALLNAGTQQNALTSNAAAEQALRYNAASGNQQALLNAQQAQSQQNLGAQAAASARQAPIYQQQNALIQALASMA